MSEFFMCYYDGNCPDAVECKRSRKSGTKAEEDRDRQGWHVFEMKDKAAPKTAENCTGYMPK